MFGKALKPRDFYYFRNGPGNSTHFVAGISLSEMLTYTRCRYPILTYKVPSVYNATKCRWTVFTFAC